MVIEIDADRSAMIKIHSNDDPIILAKSFCFQHSIDPRIINTLANNIKNVQNMEFHQNQSQHNKSKISHISDKENNSSLVNISQSENGNGNHSQFYNQKSSVNKLSRSYMTKNNTTLMSNDCSRQSVFDRLYQDSRKKKVANKQVT